MTTIRLSGYRQWKSKFVLILFRLLLAQCGPRSVYSYQHEVLDIPNRHPSTKEEQLIWDLQWFGMICISVHRIGCQGDAIWAGDSGKSNRCFSCSGIGNGFTFKWIKRLGPNDCIPNSRKSWTGGLWPWPEKDKCSGKAIELDDTLIPTPWCVKKWAMWPDQDSTRVWLWNQMYIRPHQRCWRN